jgi:hypothetical protein
VVHVGCSPYGSDECLLEEMKRVPKVGLVSMAATVDAVARLI